MQELENKLASLVNKIGAVDGRYLYSLLRDAELSIPLSHFTYQLAIDHLVKDGRIRFQHGELLAADGS